MAAISYVTNLQVGPGSVAGTLGVTGDIQATGELRGATVCINDYTMPSADGGAGCFMCTDGSGNIGWGAGGGESNIWVDGTNPYIIPCNSCGICVACISMTGNIFDADSTHTLGEASSPGAFAAVHAACGMFTTCVTGTTLVCGATVCGTTLIRGADVCATDDVIAGDDVCAGDLLLGTRININASSACTFYVSGNGIYSGTLNMTYLDGTCVCGSRKVRIPVGTNCY